MSSFSAFKMDIIKDPSFDTLWHVSSRVAGKNQGHRCKEDPMLLKTGILTQASLMVKTMSYPVHPCGIYKNERKKSLHRRSPESCFPQRLRFFTVGAS